MEISFKELDFVDLNQLTKSQQTAITKIEKFINSPNFNVIIFKGSAGTGKTYLLKLLTEIFIKLDIPFRVATPTGRSAQVLKSKGVTEAGTIHSMIYTHDNIVEEEVNGNFIYYFKSKTNQDSIQTVYLIDESSMISNTFNQDEILRFGSGRLLTDLIFYISPDNSNNRKIVFFGDDNQLPPVNSSYSPALNADSLQNILNNLQIKEISLDEVVRQAKDSGIIKNANVIKENLENKYFGSLKLNFNSDEFKEVETDSIINDFYTRYKTNKNSTVLIAYTNSSVKTYNQSLREKLFKNPSLLELNDKIIVIRNNLKYRLLNGEMGIIKKVDPFPEKIIVPLKNEKEPQELVFRKVIIEFKNEMNETTIVNPLILENVLISPESTLTKKETRALMADFISRHKGIKRSSKQFKELLQNDPYVNCLLIKYGYAITCHKAQGGEWPYVYFDFNHQSSFSADYFRFCYTGITRAKKILFAINPPFSGIATKKSNLEMQSITEPNSIFIEEKPDKILINLIKENISHLNIPITIESKSFRIRVKYLLENRPAYIDIIFKKNGLISSIQGNNTDENDLIYHELKKLKNVKIFSEENVESDNSFLLKLKADITLRLAPNKIEIKKIEHLKFQERYFLLKDDQECSINIYYNSKNRVTRIHPNTGSKLLLKESIRILHEQSG